MSVLKSKAREALALAKSMATTTATPSMMPRIIRIVCQGCRRKYRQPNLNNGLGTSLYPLAGELLEATSESDL
jgi:hypothetical protein